MKDLERFFENFSRQVRNGETHRGCLVVNTTAEFGSKDPEVAAELQNYFNFIKDMIKKVLENSVQAGEISAEIDLEKYSNYLMGIMQGLSVGAKVLNEEQINDIISVAFTNLK
jgi:TetR/AcrR family transcriptional repressor of nem operon